MNNYGKTRKQAIFVKPNFIHNQKLQRNEKSIFYLGDGIRRSNSNDLLFRQEGDKRNIYRKMGTQKFPAPNGKSYCYTPLFIDLMDNYNQRTSSNNNNRPNDNISGYTLEYIQNNILVSSYGLSSFRDALRAHKINGVTDNDISQLMELYWGYEYTR